jgi:hypothetical protein
MVFMLRDCGFLAGADIWGVEVVREEERGKEMAGLKAASKSGYENGFECERVSKARR